MDVTFATPGGREFTVEVWYFATVREMKEAVHASEGIPVASQRLFLAGREGEEDDQELDDARDTAHYGIVQGSRVVLVLPDDAPPSSSPSTSPAPAAAGVRVAVSAPEIIGPRSVALDDVPAYDTVARLKELLQDRTDGALPAARTALFLGKAEMEDGKTLADYGPPSDGMDVSAVVRPQAPVESGGGGGGNGAGTRNQQRIEVSVMFGETAVALEVGAMDVVRDLRKEVERLRLPVRDGGYFFVYKQNVMDEDRTLRWHEVKNGDTIEIFNGTVTGGA
jgi:ubiquitin C